MTARCPLLFPVTHAGTPPLAVRAVSDLLKGQSSGFVPRRTLVSLLGDIGLLSFLGGKIIDRPTTFH